MFPQIQFDVLLQTTRSFGTETYQVVNTDLLLDVGHLTLLAQLAEAEIEIGTVLSASVTRWDHVPIHALLSLLTVPIGKEIPTSRHFILLISVQVLAILAFFALGFQPVDAHDLFVLAFV